MRKVAEPRCVCSSMVPEEYLQQCRGSGFTLAAGLARGIF